MFKSTLWKIKAGRGYSQNSVQRLGQDYRQQVGRATYHRVGHAPCPQVGHTPCHTNVFFYYM